MTTSSSPVPSGRPRRKLLPSKLNERLKLAAAAFDRVSTVVVGGAILAPIIQHQGIEVGRLVFWAIAAILLHGVAQFMLHLLEEEA